MEDKECKDCATFPECEGSNIEDCQRRDKETTNLDKVREDTARKIWLGNHADSDFVWNSADPETRAYWLAKADGYLSHPLILIPADDQEVELLSDEELVQIEAVVIKRYWPNQRFIPIHKVQDYEYFREIVKAQASKMIQGDKETKWVRVIRR